MTQGDDTATSRPNSAEEQRKLRATQLFNHLFEACNILRGPINQDEFKAYVIPTLPQAHQRLLRRGNRRREGEVRRRRLALLRGGASSVQDAARLPQEKAKASLKESLAALTAAQKSLMNSSFAKAREDARVFLKEGTR